MSQYLAQLGEASSSEALAVHMFSLSFTGTTFSWLASLAPGSINLWLDLEKKSHEHFFSGFNELKLSHLTSVKQQHDESVVDYFQRFRDTKNRCFNVQIVEKDLANLSYNGLHSSFKEKLDGYDFVSVNQVLQRALAIENRIKEAREHHRQHRPNTHVIEYHSDTLDDDCAKCYLAKFAWPPTSKNVTTPCLKPIQKNRKDDMKFTFDPAKCEIIFDELLRNGYIKLSHALPSPEELKRRAWCKWHNSVSHAANDCNVFHSQLQSVLNEG